MKMKSWTITRNRTAKDILTKAEALRWSGGVSAEEAYKIQNKKSGEKIAGQESSLCSECVTCSVFKASRRSQRKEK